MKRIYLSLILIALLACNEQANDQRSSMIIDTLQSYKNAPAINSYKFDSSSQINGCADVLLQKISKDLQYELLVDLAFDSIPKFKEIDISKYLRFIKIDLNKYPKDNTYIDPICNDVPKFPYGWQPPTKFSVITGSLTITYWSDKDFIVSALVKNLVLQDSSKHTINIPLEAFEKLKVHTYGG